MFFCHEKEKSKESINIFSVMVLEEGEGSLDFKGNLVCRNEVIGPLLKLSKLLS